MSTLVLLPGMDGTGELFGAFARALPPNLRIHVTRFPCTEAMGYEELLQHTLAELSQYEDVYLLGESFSGPLSILITETLGERVRGLILCCTFVRSPLESLVQFRTLINVAPFGLVPAWAVSPLLFGRWSTPQLREQLGSSLRQVAPSVLRKRLSEIAVVDVSGALARTRAPILHLQATADALVGRSASGRIAALRPDAEAVRIDGAHCLLQTNPSECARAVARFIEGVENA